MNDSEPCKLCEQSAQLANSVQPSKNLEFSWSFVQLATAIIEQIVFTVPERLVVACESPPPDLPLAATLRDIKQSIPIRGPSITA